MKPFERDPTGEPLWALELLVSLGCEMHIDFDGELQFSVPDPLNVDTVIQQIERHKNYLAGQVKCRANRDRRLFMGGPFNGQKFGGYVYGGNWVSRVERAKWVVYEPMPDGRAVFKGFASSRAKGRRGELMKEKT